MYLNFSIRYSKSLIFGAIFKKSLCTENIVRLEEGDMSPKRCQKYMLFVKLSLKIENFWYSYISMEILDSIPGTRSRIKPEETGSNTASSHTLPSSVLERLWTICSCYFLSFQMYLFPFRYAKTDFFQRLWWKISLFVMF